MPENYWFILGRDGDEAVGCVFVDIPAPAEAESFFAELNSGPAPKTIDLFVNSMGGDLYSAMAIHDKLKDLAGNGCTVRAYVEGIAASGAALIIAAADQVFVQPDASLMLHEPRYCDGREPDERLEVMAAGMCRRIAGKLGRGADAVLDLLREGRWLNAEEAVSLGLADEVLGVEGLRV